MSFVGLKLISEFCEFIISTLTPKRFDCDKPFGLVVRCLYFRIETMNKNVSVQGNRWRLSVARKNVSTHINWCHQQNTRTQLSSQLRTHIHIQTPRIDWLCSFLFATITKSSNNPSNIFIDMSISGIRINNRIAAKSLIRKQTKKKKINVANLATKIIRFGMNKYNDFAICEFRDRDKEKMQTIALLWALDRNLSLCGIFLFIPLHCLLVILLNRK